jgi:hypothetical protein
MSDTKYLPQNAAGKHRGPNLGILAIVFTVILVSPPFAVEGRSNQIKGCVESFS